MRDSSAYICPPALSLSRKCPLQCLPTPQLLKGIVDAVRALGGRFLELDERSGIYHDIGDKRAIEKTSQALREGQTEIRKRIYAGEVKAAGLPDGAQENCSSSNFDSYQNNNVPPPNFDHDISSEGYLEYSMQVLRSLYGTEEREFGTSDVTDDTLRQLCKAVNVTPTTSVGVHAPTPSPANKDSVDMAMVFDQYSGVFHSQSQVDPLQAPIGRFTNMSSTYRPSVGDFRLTDMSHMTLASVFSINTLKQLLESTQSENSSSEYRDTIQSVVNAEVMELFQKTMPQLEDIQNGTLTEYVAEYDWEDKEVDLFREDPSTELDFRLTDVSAWEGLGARGTKLADYPEYMKNSTKSFESSMSMMSIDDNTGDKAEV
jgi:hypothetical protein